MWILYYRPLRKQLADLTALAGVVMALWIGGRSLIERFLIDAIDGLGTAVVVLLIGAVLGWLTGHALLVSWTLVTFTPGAVTIRRAFRTRVLERGFQPKYRVRPHKRAEKEKDQEERDARRHGVRERPPSRYYQKSFHVEVLYKGRPFEIATVYGAEKAERLHRRLGELDEEVSQTRGGGKDDFI